MASAGVVSGTAVVSTNPVSSVYMGHPHEPSARTVELRERVAAVKKQHLTLCEHLVKGLSGLVSFCTTLGLSGLTTVPANTSVAIFRFGKLDTVIKTPGIHWITPCAETVRHFAGTQTHESAELRVIDGAGNPIIVRALLEYAVEDATALHIATNDR